MTLRAIHDLHRTSKWFYKAETIVSALIRGQTVLYVSPTEEDAQRMYDEVVRRVSRGDIARFRREVE